MPGPDLVEAGFRHDDGISADLAGTSLARLDLQRDDTDGGTYLLLPPGALIDALRACAPVSA